MFYRYITVIILFGLIRCQSKSSGAKEEQNVKQIVNDIIAADNRSDIETVLSLYDTSAILMPPGKHIIEGIVAIRENYKQIFLSSRLELTTEVESVKIGGDWASAVGRNTGKVSILKDNSSKSIDSKFVMLLEKNTSGEWKIKRLIWNDN